MSHPQPTMAAAMAAQHAAQQRPFSPLQASGSPNPSAGIAMPPAAKKPRISPASPPSQPSSPYVNSGYAASPPATTPGATTSNTNLPSPASQNYPNPQYAPNQMNAQYQQNGHSRPTHSLPMPSPVPPPTPAPAQPTLPTPQPPHQTPVPVPAPYSNATLMPMNTSHGNMGPPSIAPSSLSAANEAQKQAAKAAPSKGSDYDMNDMLAGTGINLDEEAEKLNEFEIREGFPYHPPGGKESFYGAGPANQPAQHIDAISQEELAAEVADEAWNEAARRLTIFRTNELQHPFLEPGFVHRRLMNRASKHGLSLNLELKPDGKSHYMGRVSSPADFPKPEVKVSVKKTDDGIMVQTHESFIPYDSYLIDQIALLSIATKEHMRSLIGEANRVATTRQRTAHGVVPLEWADAAAPREPNADGTRAGSPRTGAESAVSPRTNSRKRPADEISNGLPTPVSEAPLPNFLAEALEDAGKEVRKSEEARLKKRLKRQQGDEKKDGEDGGSRAGSVAPGTPGSIAPEGETKPMTKKESKKAAKLAEISSTTVNQTLSMFAGGKKKKKYSWMNGGGAGSGANTPKAQGGPGQPGTPGGGPAGAGNRTARGPLTRDSAHRLGAFREDSEKGKNIQLRDWVAVLEDRDVDSTILQVAYNKLDKSDFGDKVTRMNVSA